MTALFITSNTFTNLTECLSWFRSFCSKTSDIIIFYEISKAKDFIENAIVHKDGQKHIDFIVSDWKFADGSIKNLLEWIRNSDKEFSSNNFQLKSVPFLLLNDSTNSYVAEGFNGVIDGFPNELRMFDRKIKEAVKDWRYDIATDLDLIGLNPKTQNEYGDSRRNFISYFRLKVLTRSFVDSKSKKLNYIWTNQDIKNLNYANEKFDAIIQKTKRDPKAFSEKSIHNFFKENPTLIKGEFFLSKKIKEELIYEPHLYKVEKLKYDEPDFLNKPYEYSFRFPEVFEIKLQTQRLLKKTKDNFLYKTRQSFKQVKRYKEYFTSSDTVHQSYIEKFLGKIYRSYDFTLLMGSEEEKEIDLDLINRLKEDCDAIDIDLITYEELLSEHIKLCDRIHSLAVL